MRQLAVCVFSAAALFSIPSFADEFETSSELAKASCPPIEKECGKPKECCEPVECCQPVSCERKQCVLPDLSCVINPKTGPLICGWGDFFVEADFLLWTRSVGFQYVGNGIGVLFNPPAAATNINVAEGNLHFAQYGSYEPGFRIRLGVDLPYDGWDVSASYLWLHGETSDNFTGNNAEGSAIAIYLDKAAGSDRVVSASSSAKYTLNFVKAQLGRKFYTHRYFTMRPNLGVIGSFIPSTFQASYSLATASLGVPLTAPYSSHSNGNGFGLSAGLDTNWYITKNWSFSAHYSWNPTWTWCTVKASRQLISATSTLTNLKKKSSLQFLQMITNVTFAINWEMPFHNDQKLISFMAGWEALYGFQNSFTNTFGFTQDYMDFSGLTLRARCDY